MVSRRLETREAPLSHRTGGLRGSLPKGPRPSASSVSAIGRRSSSVRALGELTVPLDALADPALRWYRGEPLTAMDAITRRYLADCRRVPGLDLDLDACVRVWEAATTLPGPDDGVAPRWLHGDLLAENLLRKNRLTAVLDFGGLSVGDPDRRSLRQLGSARSLRA